MSTTTEDPSNLTTDAYPSPPRQNGETSTIGPNSANVRRDSASSNRSRNRDSDSDDHESDSNSKKSGTGTRFTKSYDGFPTPNTFANVINISNASGVQIGSNFTIVMKTPMDKNQKKTKQYIKTDKILALFNSQETVTEKDIQFVATHMDETWMETARNLDYSEGQIGQFNCDFVKNSLKEVIYQFLLDWIRNNADAATVGKLSRTLWKSGQKDCVTRWSVK